jgi:hypothetical protein
MTQLHHARREYPMNSAHVVQVVEARRTLSYVFYLRFILAHGCQQSPELHSARQRFLLAMVRSDPGTLRPLTTRGMLSMEESESVPCGDVERYGKRRL